MIQASSNFHIFALQGPLHQQQCSRRRHLRPQVHPVSPRALCQGESPQCRPVLPTRLLPPLLLVPLQPQPGHPGEQGPVDRVDQAVQGAGVTQRLWHQESVEVKHKNIWKSLHKNI